MRTAYRQRSTNDINTRRVAFMGVIVGLCFIIIVTRLFYIQIVKHEKYQDLADRQHLMKADYAAERGEIFATDRTNEGNGSLYPLAVNKDFYEVYLNPSEIDRPINTAEAFRDIFDAEYEVILARAEKENDIYEPGIPRATEEQIDRLKETGLDGIYWKRHLWRYYPDKEIGSHILGFYGIDDNKLVGRYGIEGFWEEELAGLNQEAIVARDRKGSIIPEGEEFFDLAIDGSDIVLTIDRTIQFEACKRLEETIEQFAADEGSVVIMESQTGRIRSMCNFPSFDPNNYNEVEDVSWFNNDVVFEAYEPGSVFKPISMAIAIDQEKVTPTTVYEDMGEVKISGETIRNFDQKAHGIRTMTEVLQESLNLGVIFATQEVSNAIFANYVKNFGFGEYTNIDIGQDSKGSLGQLGTFKDIYKATASFGQGITATPLQVLGGINTIANNGVLIRPYIVEEIRKSDGTIIKTQKKEVRHVIRSETAQTVSAMLVKVLEEGYDSKGSVDGYYLAGKTGTAQIAEKGEYGQKTNHTFVGFGPTNDPQFTILIKLHNVKNVKYAADSTTQLFHDLAEFLINYYRIPPHR